MKQGKIKVRKGERRKRRNRRRALALLVAALAVAAFAAWGIRKASDRDREAVRVASEGERTTDIPAEEAAAQGEQESVEEDEAYPKDLEELLEANPETEDFVKEYGNREKWLQREVRLTKEELATPAPLFLQWDKRWGYQEYGGKMMALNGCGPTCLSMVLVGLGGKTEMNPLRVAQYSEDMGYVTEDTGTSWELMTKGATDLGLTAMEISLDESVIQSHLEDGEQIICSMRPGDFTTTGHFIVIYGEQGGKFLIHDPNSKERSEKLWDFEDIKGQIKNLWSYS